MRITRTRVAALAATATVLIAALAGSAQPTSAAPAAKQANIVQTAVAAGQFKTLAKLLKAPGWPTRCRARARSPSSRRPTPRSRRCRRRH